MDIVSDSELSSNPDDENMADDLSPPTPSHDPQDSQSKAIPNPGQASQSLASSIHAGPVIRGPTSNARTSKSQPAVNKRRVTSQLPSTTNNEFAAALTAWQNAGASHLKNLPPAIAADLRAITTRSAARVIAGLPVFDEPHTLKSSPNQNTAAAIIPDPRAQDQQSLPNASHRSLGTQKDRRDTRAPAAAHSYAAAAHRGIHAPSLNRNANKPPPTTPKSDARVIVRLPANHPLRSEDPFLVRTKLRRLLSRPELIKDIRIVPTGLALVAPSPSQAHDLLEAAKALKPITGEAIVELQEKRLTYLLGPVPKYGYNAQGNREALSLDEIRQELEAEKITSDSIYAMSWTRRSNESPRSDGTIRLVLKASAIKSLPNNVRLFAQAVRLRPANDRPLLPSCSKCYGFHNINACTRSPRCRFCAAESHTGPCSTPHKCLNCLGPHSSDEKNCPARPRRENGVFVRPDKGRLQHIRRQGHKAWLAVHPSATAKTSNEQISTQISNIDIQPCVTPISTQVSSIPSPPNPEEQL
ncbi:hypothetical protein K3495_g15033 [Podosphaera aphanis]|nr:hypothetical protein K3495_g15033 [Podosphaera aphanis]